MVRLVLAAESRVSVPFSLVHWYSCAVLNDLPFFSLSLVSAPSLPRSPSLTLRIMFFSWVFLSSAFGISSCISTYTIRDSMM